MGQTRAEENRYCPTCQKKTVHWVTHVTSPISGKPQGDQPVKTECRICGTVDER